MRGTWGPKGIQARHVSGEDIAMRRSEALAAVVGVWVLVAGPAVGARAEDGPKGKADKTARPANRLAKETSPYLLLHAHNPVDWYPWGPEAFAKAKKEDRPIFLSVGYSSCYWCHVMERECFMDEAIAKKLNARFVCIKVDREERPDVDQVYMAALQAFSGGGGGWPMSIVMTPDGRPFFGGTYFPPAPRDGLPGFPQILDTVADAWRDHRAELEKDADNLTEAVRRSLARAARRRVPLARALAAEGRAALAEQFDPDFGGFGYNPDRPRRPKFPEPVNLVFLLDQHRRYPDRSGPPGVIAARLKGPEPLSMVITTLDHMARGGIRDHLAGGYHRYSTDRSWTVPHFEKMLYDNAQVASAQLLAFEATHDDRWRREAESIFAFVARTMTSPEGAFYSALDAETEGDEGGYYVWTRAQVARLLGDGDDVRLFARVYGLDRDPNFEGDRYVLREPRPRKDVAAALDTTPEAIEARLAPLRAKLLAARDKRPAPLRDEKILTSWNALMIAAYADGFRVLKEPRYRRAAESAADYLLAKHRAPDGRLLRTSRGGQAKLAAYLEDYAFLADALLRLHIATGDPERLAQARALADRMVADFADAKGGGFYYTAEGHESLLARPKDPYDNALPSGNSVAIRLLVALAKATGETRYLDVAGRALDAFGAALADNPGAAPLMLVGLDEYLDARPQAAREPNASAGDPKKDGRDVLAAEAALARGAAVAPGREVDVHVTLTIKPGWHLSANPSGSDTLKPTALALAPDSAAELVKVDYPKGASKTLAGEALSVYEGNITLAARVRLPADARGPSTLDFRIRYQACDDRACLAPAVLPVSLKLDGAH
jgi:uncharacterized protein YyaL (SSP411 family)